MNDERTDHSPLLNAEAPASLNRRILIGGAAAAGLATAGFLRLAAAQTDSGTPEADATEDAATPDASSSTSTDDAARVIAVIDDARARLAAVEASRDAVADQIDATAIDKVLGQASTLLDEAQAFSDGGDAEAAWQPLVAARQSVRAVRELIVAQITYAGLPSQEVPASLSLAKAYEAIGDVTSDDAVVGFYVTTAQGVYESACDQYGSGAYASALANGEAILALAAAASVLSGEGGAGRPGLFGGCEMAGPGPFGKGGFGRDDRERGTESPMDITTGPVDEPETVPAPDF